MFSVYLNGIFARLLPADMAGATTAASIIMGAHIVQPKLEVHLAVGPDMRPLDLTNLVTAAVIMENIS